MRDCLYIEPGDVCSLTHYFHVPKGPKIVIMVYNGTGCDLNAAFWAPHFGLPYATHTTMSLMPGYCQCDFDAGDMFLNFLLHEELKRMSGVDIRHDPLMDPKDAEWEASRQRDWERWGRN